MYKGKAPIPTALLDASGGIPLLLLFATYAYAFSRKRFSIGLWNKTFLVASCMAIVKGVFDVVTIMPDSSGWKTCMKRLGGDATKAFGEVQLQQDGISELPELIALELFGNEGKRVRYCADMMVSGHTYFATLFSLSTYKMTALLGIPWAKVLVGIVCTVCIAMEVALVAAARFHYTVDMLAAILLVGLFFDSVWIDGLASDWSEGFLWCDPDKFVPKSCVAFRWFATSRQRSLGYETMPGLAAIVPSRSSGLLNLRIIFSDAHFERGVKTLQASRA